LPFCLSTATPFASATTKPDQSNAPVAVTSVAIINCSMPSPYYPNATSTCVFYKSPTLHPQVQISISSVQSHLVQFSHSHFKSWAAPSNFSLELPSRCAPLLMLSGSFGAAHTDEAIKSELTALCADTVFGIYVDKKLEPVWRLPSVRKLVLRRFCSTKLCSGGLEGALHERFLLLARQSHMTGKTLAV
jgi:hypothetical protein